MKNMVSALVVLLSLFIRECRGGGHSSSAERSTDDPMIGEGGTARQRNSKANHDSLDPNPALDAVTNEKECDYNNFDMVDKPWVGLAGDIEDVAKQYNLTQQDIKNLDTYENVFNKADSNRSASSPSAGKRKASCTVDSSVDGSESVAGEKRRKEEDSVYVDDKREDDEEYIDAEIEAAIDNHIQMISRLRASAGKKTKETIAPKEHSMIRWQSTKLTNLVRHRHVITYDNLHECRHSAKYLNGLAKDNVYQRKLKNDIKYFFDNISSLIKDNGFLYFLASRPTRLNPKHRYLFGTKYLCVNSENTAYKKMVESFAGYYPGIVDDLIAYLEENEPMKIREDKFPAEWKRTLGDIYMSECPKVNYKMFKKQRNIAQVDSRHRALAYAMHMIIMLPEVYQDFSKISEKFIEETCNSMSDDKDRNKRNVQIILVMREIMRMHIGEIIDEAAYAKLYNMLKSVLGEARMLQATAVDLYAHIYSFLVEFYKKAVIFDKNNRYVLVGKYVIKKQRQIKGEIVVNMAAGKPEERMSAPSYSFEEGIWSVSPVKHSHYHVYYVDNTMGQPRRLCMPIYKGEESKEEQYLHTIDGIVEYIKELYEMAKNSDFIHPFKVDKETKKWSYISASDRSKTAKELEGYEVVFYHIKDSLEENFTFAEFEPAEPYGANRIPIPLFLTPLMEKGMVLGPFTKKKKQKETNLANPGDDEEIQIISPDGENPDNKESEVYEYGDKYKDEKYKNISGYYCNLYILPGDIKSIECYAMNCELKKQENGSTSVVWYARVLGDVDEYTHCVPSEDFKKETAFSDFHFFVSAIESREYNRDSSLQSFWLSNTSPNNSGDGQTFTINDLLEDRKIETLPGFKNMENLKKDLISVEKYLKRLEDYKMILERLHDTDPEQLKKRKKSLQSIIREQKSLLKALQIELHTKVSKRPKNTEINLIVFRNMNSTRSNLGAHNEILDVFISTYQKRH